jgi:hypothetical protein
MQSCIVMPTFVTFYGYAFEGAPLESSRGWFAAPDVPHLVATRARTALGRATGERVWIYRCTGSLDDTKVHCDEAELLYAGDATESLWWFTVFCARSVATRWNAPDLVREYLKSTSPALREVAHRCAWAASIELDGPARLAARTAMYAASAERPVIAAREACRLAGQIAGDKLRTAASAQERALASALLATPRASADALPSLEKLEKLEKLAGERPSTPRLGSEPALPSAGNLFKISPPAAIAASERDRYRAYEPSAEALPPPPYTGFEAESPSLQSTAERRVA